MFLLLVVLLSLSTTAAFASMITNGTFSIAGTIFVTGSGGVTTPGGICPAGIVCIFFQDTSTPAINDKIDIAPMGLPNGDIPLAIAGINAGHIFNLMNPPDTVGTLFPPAPFMTFNNAGITTALDIDFIPAGVNGTAQCGLPPAPGQLCTPPGSLFNLQNLTATSSSVGWRFQGITNDSASTWTGPLHPNSTRCRSRPYWALWRRMDLCRTHLRAKFHWSRFRSPRRFHTCCSAARGVGHATIAE
jgi:hypothetical protein